MRWKSLFAVVNLAGHFALRLLKRLLFIRSAGLKKFLEFYREDKIVAFDLSEKGLLIEAGRCISCGLCDAFCRASPSLLPHFSRSVPDFSGVVNPDFSSCDGCRGCEVLCPERVPIKKIIAFLASKTGFPTP